jgi:hypothetical protein
VALEAVQLGGNQRAGDAPRDVDLGAAARQRAHHQPFRLQLRQRWHVINAPQRLYSLSPRTGRG